MVTPLKQYYEYLYAYQSSVDTGRDVNGSFVASADAGWTYICECREETNGKGNVINGVDGRSFVYSSLIFTPVESTRITEGTKLLVSKKGMLIGTITEDVISDCIRSGECVIVGTCKKQDIGRLHNRIWV